VVVPVYELLPDKIQKPSSPEPPEGAVLFTAIEVTPAPAASEIFPEISLMPVSAVPVRLIGTLTVVVKLMFPVN
jgi:hypothetical protein